MKNATRRFAGPFGDATNTVDAVTVMEPSKDRPESVSRRLRSKRLRSKSEPQRYATLRESEISLDAVDTEVASAIVDVSVPPMAAIYDRLENRTTNDVAVPQPSICEEVKIHAELPAPEDLQPSIYDVNVVDGKYEPWSHPGGYTGYNDATPIAPFESWNPYPYHSQSMPPPTPLSQIAIPEANILIPLPANYLLYPYPSVTFPNLLPRLIVRILPGPPQPKYYFHGPDGEVFEVRSRDDVLTPQASRTDEEDFYEVRYYDSEDEHVEWAMSRVGPIRVFTYQGEAGYPGASYIYYGV
ncbi:hypothetical protein R3P38DRAFT_2761249 [Favolaschia claudopus]|uniref:Uncharacterized protein n=1 Tax=Favolaschia claudopus TaxID=2862362 RepID=A0AAW0DWY3_9AGAR